MHLINTSGGNPQKIKDNGYYVVNGKMIEQKH